MDDSCLFCKIATGAIPVAPLYEDEDVLAFSDIAPQAPVHFLVIPKKYIIGPAAIGQEDEQLLGKMLRTAATIAQEQGIGDQYRVVANNGAKAGQTVFHLHLHILGGRAMQWPPG